MYTVCIFTLASPRKEEYRLRLRRQGSISPPLSLSHTQVCRLSMNFSPATGGRRRGGRGGGRLWGGGAKKVVGHGHCRGVRPLPLVFFITNKYCYLQCAPTLSGLSRHLAWKGERIFRVLRVEINMANPHGALRTFYQKSTCLIQSTSRPYMVHIWSRYPQNSGERNLGSPPSGCHRDADRGTSLTTSTLPVRPCSSPMPRNLW